MTEKEKGNRVMQLVNAAKERNEETSGCLTTTELLNNWPKPTAIGFP